MKGNVGEGLELLKIQYPKISDICIKATQSHHERVDGSGYPKGSIDQEISLWGKMVAVVDAYDAMVTDRCYASTKNHHEALIELKACSGHQFDEPLVNHFIDFYSGYPLGTLVLLEDCETEYLAVVTKAHQSNVDRPVVLKFYIPKAMQYIDEQSVDTNCKDIKVRILKSVTAEEYGLTMTDISNWVH